MIILWPVCVTLSLVNRGAEISDDQFPIITTFPRPQDIPLIATPWPGLRTLSRLWLVTSDVSCYLIGQSVLMCDQGCHSQDSWDTIGTPGFYLIKDQWMEGGPGLKLVAFPFLHSPQQILQPSTMSHLATPNKLWESSIHRMWKPEDKTFELQLDFWKTRHET